MRRNSRRPGVHGSVSARTQDSRRSPDPYDDLSRSASSARSACCPCDLCPCCPPPVRGCIPGTLRKVQDWTHFALIIGMIGSFMIVVKTLYQLCYVRQCTIHYCPTEILGGLTLPCGCYIMSMLGSYDERIQEKERQIVERRKELHASYDSLITSMDDLLEKAAESSATMAERSFESKRRDFQRFLERAESRYSQMVGTAVDTEMMVEQFRRFVQRWLVVFEECSVDPIARPKRVVTEDRLDRCTTIGEIARVTLEGLKLTEVRFISSQRDKDQKELKGFRRYRKAMDSGAPASPLQELELMPYSARSGGDSTPSFVSDEGSDIEVAESSRSKKSSGRSVQLLPCTWLQCACGKYDCKLCHSAVPGQHFPRKTECCCFQLVLISFNQVMLMAGFVCALVIVALEVLPWGHDQVLAEAVPVLEHDPDLIMGIAGAFYAICLVVLLIRFEQIDIVQRLEREVNQLTEENQKMKDRKDQMSKFWSEMQELTDLWVHRTVPRLDLLKEIQGHLEDAPTHDVLALMAGANTRLEDLENHLPQLRLWRGSGELSEEQKKIFAQRIEKLCREEQLPKILHGIHKVIEERVLSIDPGLPGPQLPKPSALALAGAARTVRPPQAPQQRGPQRGAATFQVSPRPHSGRSSQYRPSPASTFSGQSRSDRPAGSQRHHR